MAEREDDSDDERPTRKKDARKRKRTRRGKQNLWGLCLPLAWCSARVVGRRTARQNAAPNMQCHSRIHARVQTYCVKKEHVSGRMARYARGVGSPVLVVYGEQSRCRASLLLLGPMAIRRVSRRVHAGEMSS